MSWEKFDRGKRTGGQVFMKEFNKTKKRKWIGKRNWKEDEEQIRGAKGLKGRKWWGA